MNKCCIIIIALLTVSSLKGQSCLPEGMTFITQAQVDSFQVNYPGCTQIEGNVLIKGMNSINNLEGLSVLTSVGGNLAISFNYLLASLTGLDNLNSIGGDLNIFSNDVLTSLDGLESINAGSIISLRIAGNELLSTCAIASICDYLASPNGTIEIHNNAPGCNSPEEVDSTCVYLSNGKVVNLPVFSIYPNPSSNAITIELPNTTTPSKKTILTVYSVNGKQIIQRQITEPTFVVDVSGLVSGIYFVKLVSDDEVRVGKFVKQ